MRTTLNTRSHLRISVKNNPIRVAFDTTLRACGATAKVFFNIFSTFCKVWVRVRVM